MISLKDIAVLYGKELRCALRERNIIINSLLIPIFLYPTMLWIVYTGISFVGGQTEGFVSRVSLQGLPPTHKALLDELKKDEQIQIVQAHESEIAAGRLDLFLEFQQAVNPNEQNYIVRLSYDKTQERSQTAFERVSAILARYRDRAILKRSERLGVDEKTLRGFTIDEENTATKLQMGQFILGLILPLFLIVMMALGAFYPAVDATAGEREKSTWETLFVTATHRNNVVIAKYLYVATLSFFAGMLNLCAMLVSMKSVLAPLFGGSTDLSFRLPIGAYPVIALCGALLSLFIAAGMMLLASFARTFKEGQSLVTPFYIGVFMPVMFLQMPGIKFTIYLALVPVVNVAMVFREAISGTFNWPMIAVTIAVEVLCVAASLKLAGAVLRYEDFLIGSYDGSLMKFIKERIWASPLK